MVLCKGQHENIFVLASGDKANLVLKFALLSNPFHLGKFCPLLLQKIFVIAAVCFLSVNINSLASRFFSIGALCVMHELSKFQVYFEAEPKPVFYVASRGHHADIGGLSPGSMPPHSTRLSEEGATFAGFVLVRDGEFQEEGTCLLVTLKER